MGNILEDESAITIITQAQQLGSDIAAKQQEGDETEATIDAVRIAYAPCGTYLSTLFFCISGMMQAECHSACWAVFARACTYMMTHACPCPANRIYNGTTLCIYAKTWQRSIPCTSTACRPGTASLYSPAYQQRPPAMTFSSGWRRFKDISLSPCFVMSAVGCLKRTSSCLHACWHVASSQGLVLLMLPSGDSCSPEAKVRSLLLHLLLHERIFSHAAALGKRSCGRPLLPQIPLSVAPIQPHAGCQTRPGACCCTYQHCRHLLALLTCSLRIQTPGGNSSTQMSHTASAYQAWFLAVTTQQMCFDGCSSSGAQHAAEHMCCSFHVS